MVNLLSFFRRTPLPYTTNSSHHLTLPSIANSDTYLITLGAYRQKPGTDPSDWDAIDWVKSHVMISGGKTKSFLLSKNLDCGPHHKKGWDDHWTDFEHADMPAKVRIHGGHACTTGGRDDNWDNVWIEWNDQHVDVPSDKRCGSLGMGEGEFVNCYIKM